MGRRKIEMKYIEKKTNRQATYSKRKKGILKKANELAILCDAQVCLIMFSDNGKLAEYISPSTTMKDIFDRYEKKTNIDLSASDQYEVATVDLLKSLQNELRKQELINSILRKEIRNLQPNMEDRQQVLQDRVVGETNATDGVQHTVGVVDTANLEVLNSNGVVEVSKKTVESGDVIEEPFIKSKTYARRNKSSSKKGNSHEQIPICYLNPYNVLGSDHETVISEIPKSTENDSRVVEDCDIAQISVEKLPENLEDDPEVDTCEDSNEEPEYETDNDVLDVAKVKSVEEVSRWKPMSKEQNMDKLMKFSSLICLPSGGKETEVKKLLGGIVDSFHSSKQIKDLGPSTEDLGRGKRTPIPKKKL